MRGRILSSRHASPNCFSHGLHTSEGSQPPEGAAGIAAAFKYVCCVGVAAPIFLRFLIAPYRAANGYRPIAHSITPPKFSRFCTHSTGDFVVQNPKKTCAVLALAKRRH